MFQTLSTEQQAQMNKDKDSNDPAAKKRRLDTISDCVASNVIDITDQDELEVYGSDIRTSTQLTSYVFEVCARKYRKQDGGILAYS